jgi:hypothetical protein
MNRWIQWARRLRSRHGRVETRRLLAGMVFHRPLRMLRPRQIGSSTRIRISVYAPMRVVLRPMIAAPLQAHAPQPQVFVTQMRQLVGSLQTPADVTSVERLPIPGTLQSTKFVHTHSAATVHTKSLERIWLPVCELAAVWLRKPLVTTEAQALPMRLRQNSVRAERSPADLPRIVNPARRDAPRKTASARTPEAGPASRTPASWAQPPAPVPVINVDTLTSQVMQQIDRRLVAYRERMGRV